MDSLLFVVLHSISFWYKSSHSSTVSSVSNEVVLNTLVLKIERMEKK